MAYITNILSIPLDGTGVEIPTLNVSEYYSGYLLTGTVIAIGNYAIVPTGAPQLGTTFKFIYDATLDITTNGTTFSLFGTSITQAQLLKTWTLEAVYNGTTWDTNLLMDFSETQMVSTDNLTDNSVTTVKINSLAVTSSKLATDSVTTIKVVDSAITTAKIADGAVTDVKITDVDGSKLTAASVANSKLAQMANLTIKGNMSGASSTPQDLSLITPSGIAGLFWGTSGNSGLTAGTDFLGTTDSIDVVFKYNNVESGRINDSEDNTSFGIRTLVANIAGTDNTAFGWNALQANTNGIYNTGVGSQALFDTTTGIGNTAIGASSLSNVTTGIGNVGVGYLSLDAVNNGGNNIGIGASSGTTLTSGSNNVIIGYTANVSASNASNRIALGYNAQATSDNSFFIPSSITTVSFSAATITSEGLAITSKSINTTAGDSSTQNATAGRFRKDTSGASFVLTNSYITANSIIMLTPANAAIDATATSWTISATGGSATITFNAAPTSNFDMNFWVVN